MKYQDDERTPDWQLEAAEFSGYVVSQIALTHKVPRADVWGCIQHIADQGSQMDREQVWEF